MLPAKIRLTNEMINKIKTARIAKRIPAAVLARAIDRDDSYISSLELNRLRTISSVDLVAILGFLYSIPEHIAIERAEALIGMSNMPDGSSVHSLHSSPSSDGSNGLMTVNEQPLIYNRYDARVEYAEPELINDLLEVLVKHITEFYEKDPKEAVYVLNSFIKTMQFDPDFTMSFMGIPFFALRELSIDDRKEVLADLSNVYRKHAATLKPAGG